MTRVSSLREVTMSWKGRCMGEVVAKGRDSIVAFLG